ncbi:hypothetical protein HRbin06_00861 [archaeon HR06]|nr:hypothetical protein HRbin06_00861 [archaeon HR06]
MSKKRLFIVVIVILIIILITVTFSLTFFQLTQPKELTMMEFGFNGALGGPRLELRKGETFKLTLLNKGALMHEFMIIKDKDSYSLKVKDLVEKSKDEEEAEKALEELMETQTLRVIKVGDKILGEVELKPNEGLNLELRIDSPGKYYYVCSSFSGTFPKTHLEMGMFGEIVVR